MVALKACGMSPDTFSPRLPLCEQVCLVLPLCEQVCLVLPLCEQVSLVLSIPSADTALLLYVTVDFATLVCLPLYPFPITLQAIRKSRFTNDVRTVPGYFLKDRFIGEKDKVLSS